MINRFQQRILSDKTIKKLILLHIFSKSSNALGILEFDEIINNKEHIPCPIFERVNANRKKNVLSMIYSLLKKYDI